MKKTASDTTGRSGVLKKDVEGISDSLWEEFILEVSRKEFPLEDTTIAFYYTPNRGKRVLSLNDSLEIALSQWDFANYYYVRNRKDDAYLYYSKALEIYQNIGDKIDSGRLLVSLAIIQKDVNDYVGSEATTIKAIGLLAPSNDHFSLYLAYNNLGFVLKEMGDYKKSLYYYEKALKRLRKFKMIDNIPALYNDVGLVYKDKGEYVSAIDYFEKGLKFSDDLSKSTPKIYAELIDNKAHTRLYLKDSTGVRQQILEALKIRQAFGQRLKISTSYLHLADYFLYKKDTVNALQQAIKAKEIAAKSKNPRDLLSALKFLYNHMNGDKALAYAKRYIQIDDSIYRNERAVRNKYARIRFETDEYISQKERLQQRVIRIVLISGGILLILILLYIVLIQRNKSRLLRQKQEADQEIYDLTLAHQKELEKDREKIKQRLSRELHDGVLGRIFGARLNLEALNEDDDAESKQKRAAYIEEVRKIAEEIRLISHKMGKNTLIKTDFNSLLREFIKKQPDTVNLQLSIDPSIDWNLIGNALKINIYRIIQEGVNNIYKHAQATKAGVTIKKAGNALLLVIEDDGKGFSKGKFVQGIGLKNIKKRSRSVGGKCSIHSNSGGTSLRITLSLG